MYTHTCSISLFSPSAPRLETTLSSLPPQDPNLFSFLSPLSLGVWIYMMTAYLAVSLLLYILAR